MNPKWPGYGRGALVSLLLYATSVALGFLIDFRVTLFLLLALQVTWTPYCLGQFVRLRRIIHEDQFAAESYRFAAGGFLASALLLAVVVLLTQTV